tara:strand:- start:4809 stop:5018 length:210 start_codon:yes stop_codon:yes gene_type:complete
MDRKEGEDYTDLKSDLILDELSRQEGHPQVKGLIRLMSNEPTASVLFWNGLVFCDLYGKQIVDYISNLF